MSTLLPPTEGCALCASAYAEIASLRAAVEQLQVQLAGCLTAAEGHTSDPATKEMYGWSFAYEQVLRLRLKFDKAEAVARAAEKIWGVIPVTGPGTLGPDVAVPMLAYEDLRRTLATYHSK